MLFSHSCNLKMHIDGYSLSFHLKIVLFETCSSKRETAISALAEGGGLGVLGFSAAAPLSYRICSLCSQGWGSSVVVASSPKDTWPNLGPHRPIFVLQFFCEFLPAKNQKGTPLLHLVFNWQRSICRPWWWILFNLPWIDHSVFSSESWEICFICIG